MLDFNLLYCEGGQGGWGTVDGGGGDGVQWTEEGGRGGEVD